MPLSPRRLVAAGSLLALFASPVVWAADPPNIPVAFSTESVAGCTSKGVVALNLTDVNSDVPAIRSPEMRLRVAKLGGNVVPVLPSSDAPSLPSASEPGNGSRQVSRIVSATVYACLASKFPKPPATETKK